jgi:polyisoprenoid-binding protein YceI
VTRRYGPSTGDLLLYTHRDGAAARAGHDLVLRVTDWEAEHDAEADRIELTARPDSIEVLEGSGGVKPLSDRDRREIRKTIVAKVLGSDPISFRAVGIESQQGADRYAVEGDLTIRGRTAPVRWELELGADGHVVGEAVVEQSAFGIKPYTAFLGALKVSDAVEVRFSGSAAS